jgi:hypothetical protein
MEQTTPTSNFYLGLENAVVLCVLFFWVPLFLILV